MKLPSRLLLLCLLPLMSCDPAYPTASGEIRLGAGVQAGGCLHIASYEVVGEERVAQRLISPLSVTPYSFPMRYESQGALGTSQSLELVVVAWLSASCDSRQAPTADEPWGERSYSVTSCGSICGAGRTCGCGSVSGVDIDITVH